MNPPPLYLADAFVHGPFSGNPAAVCVLDAAANPDWMQQVASEVNQSETAFVRRNGKQFEIRWFTPTTEVDLCGHATLAAAHILWQMQAVSSSDSIEFTSRSGRLFAENKADWITLNFPSDPPGPWPIPDPLFEALGTAPKATLTTSRDLLVVLNDEQQVRDTAPDMERISALPYRGIIITSESTIPGVDFVSRFFAPRSGIPEDPVTGSAHCALTPYWADRLNRNQLVARQLSARGGELRVHLDGERVYLQGQAVTQVSGHWRGTLPPTAT